MGSGRACGHSTFEPRRLNPALGPSGVGAGPHTRLTPAGPQSPGHTGPFSGILPPSVVTLRSRQGRLTSDLPGDSVTHSEPQRTPRAQHSKKEPALRSPSGPTFNSVESTASRGSLNSSGDAARTAHRAPHTALQGTGGGTPRFTLVWGEGSRATTQNGTNRPRSRAKAVPSGEAPADTASAWHRGPRRTGWRIK